MVATKIQEIAQLGKSLTKNPQRGAPINDTPGLRKLLVPIGKYGYIIHYILLDEEVLILRVYHGRSLIHQNFYIDFLPCLTVNSPRSAR
jgi:plasmid stabilization system protein ParE